MGTLGWSLIQRGKTWYVKHRISLDSKTQCLVTTQEHDKEKALAKAIQIVNTARKHVEYALSTADPERAMSLIKQGLIEIDDPAVDQLSAQEEDILLGNKLDEINPRLTTLWTFGETSADDRGQLVDYYKQEKNSINIFRNKRSAIRPLFQFLSSKGIRRIKEVTSDHLSEFYGLMKQHYNKVSSLGTMDIHIRNMYNWLGKNYGISAAYPVIERNDTNTPRFKVVGENQILSDDDIKKIKDYLPTDSTPFRLFILGLTTGMRKTEMINLLWESVSFTTETITVTANQQDADNGVSRSFVKTRKSHRSVPILSTLMPYLKQWKEENTDNSPYVIHTRQDRNSYHQGQVDKNLKQLVPKWHIHILRHTFISRALLIGKVSPSEVALWVGDSVDTVLGTYSHFIQTGNIEKVKFNL